MQKRTIFSLSALACVLAGVGILSRPSATRADAPVAPGAVYAQLSSEVTQDPKDTKPYIVEMQSNDALQGLDHVADKNNTTITVKEAGAYFVVAAVQVGKDAPGDAGDYLDIWIKQNGTDVANSGCRQVIHDPKFTAVMVCQGVAECKAGDTFQVAISASSAGKGIGIKVIKPAGEPVIPSIIFSMYKIK